VYQYPLAFGCFIDVYVSPPLPLSANTSESAPAHDLGSGRVQPVTHATATAALQRFVPCASWRSAGRQPQNFHVVWFRVVTEYRYRLYFFNVKACQIF
jgi:hypothetical protein